jgi:phosphoribosylamine--glycine ligase
MTRILVVGSGGREHAMGLALATSEEPLELFFAPGNPGTDRIGKNFPVGASDVPGLVDLARSHEVALVVVGPEAPLVAGLADSLAEVGIPCCGPVAAAALLEGSKRFCRELAEAVGAPGPVSRVVTEAAQVEEAVRSFPAPPVVKADGLAGGKGVYLPDTHDAAMTQARELLEGSLGDAGRTVLLEERLEGVEASLFYACHGTEAVALPHAQDHKRLGDGDRGPNTGGMGALSPNPAITPELEEQVHREVIAPVLAELDRRGTPFAGFLFAGLMLTAEGPKLLEFNVRLGDPETQVILPRLVGGAFHEMVKRVVSGDLDGWTPGVDEAATCAVVLAAEGYPASPRKGDVVAVDPGLEDEDRWLIHAGTREEDGHLLTAGGRVAAVVARARTEADARRHAYEGVRQVQWDGMQYRRDIGATQEVTR